MIEKRQGVGLPPPSKVLHHRWLDTTADVYYWDERVVRSLVEERDKLAARVRELQAFPPEAAARVWARIEAAIARECEKDQPKEPT